MDWNIACISINTWMCIYISKYIWYYRLCRYTLYIHIYLLAISSCINAKWGLSRLYSSLRKIGAEIPFTFHPLALGLFFWKLSSFFLCYGCQHQFARLRSTLYSTVYLVWSENDLHLHTSSDICMYRLQVLDYRENLVLKNVPIIKFYYIKLYQENLHFHWHPYDSFCIRLYFFCSLLLVCQQHEKRDRSNGRSARPHFPEKVPMKKA